MSAEEKILQSITEDAMQQAEKITDEAKAQAQQITEEAKTSAKEYSAKVVSAALLKAQAIKKNAESGAELTVRDARLAKKHEEISKTIDMALEKIAAMPDEEYFALLTNLVSKNVSKSGGIIIPGSEDSKRNLAVFEKMLKEKGLDLQIVGASSHIKNGFILKWGDVEYNFSLDAVIADKKSILEDRINKVLFAE